MYIIYIKLKYIYSTETVIVRVEIERLDIHNLNKATLDELVYTKFGADVIESYSIVTKEEYDDWIKRITIQA